jgi:hypothetical protein
MPWLFWSKPTAPASDVKVPENPQSQREKSTPSQWYNPATWWSSLSSSRSSINWNDTINTTDWSHYTEPRNWIPTILVTTTALGALQFYRSYLRRIPGTAYIAPGAFRRKTLLGRVTSVGDGDNFHMFHTPGGRLAGWGWLRKIPSGRTELKGRTVWFPPLPSLS